MNLDWPRIVNGAALRAVIENYTCIIACVSERCYDLATVEPNHGINKASANVSKCRWWPECDNASRRTIRCQGSDD